MAYVGRAWGKLLLFGEHAAVYGYPAVGIALPETLEVEIGSGNQNQPVDPEVSNDGPYATLVRSDSPPFSALLQTLESLFPPISTTGVFDRLRDGFRVVSSIPQSLGYGSSAALCSALSRATLTLLADVGVISTEREVWRVANSLERVFHGTPSGIDTGLATLGGIQAFRFGDSELPSATQLPHFAFSMVTGAVPRESSTGHLVGKLRAQLESGDSILQEHLATLGRVAEQGIETIRDPAVDQIGAIGELASKAHSVLREIGLSTEPMETAIQTGLSAGATGGKLSGAGGGGAFYLMFRKTEEAKEAHSELRRALSRYAGSDIWPLRVFETDGDTVRRVAA